MDSLIDPTLILIPLKYYFSKHQGENISQQQKGNCLEKIPIDKDRTKAKLYYRKGETKKKPNLLMKAVRFLIGQNLGDSVIS